MIFRVYLVSVAVSCLLIPTSTFHNTYNVAYPTTTASLSNQDDTPQSEVTENFPGTNTSYSFLANLFQLFNNIKNDFTGVVPANHLYEKTNQAKDEDRCTICLNEYEEGESVAQLNCPNKHRFHESCIEELNDFDPFEMKCPLCRQNVNAIDRSYKTYSDDEDLWLARAAM